MARGASLRQYNGAESNVPSLVLTQRFIYVSGGSVVEVSRIRSILVTFCLFLRTSPIHFALLGRKRKYIKSKTTAKLIEKRTSIAAVRDKLGQNDTFLTPLLSGCRLPLMKQETFKQKSFVALLLSVRCIPGGNEAASRISLTWVLLAASGLPHPVSCK